MPADFWLAVAFLGFVVAASLLVCGVWKLDMRLLAGGAVLAGVLWLAIAFTSADEWTGRELVTLRLRPVDAVRREFLSDAVVNAVAESETGAPAVCRLPARLEVPSGESGGVLAVSLVVEMRVKGSLAEQYYEPAAHTQVVDQTLEVTAPGYRAWRGTLRQFLPEGWPVTPPSESPIAVELTPH